MTDRTRRDRRRTYERVLATVAHNTGDPQPPLIAEAHVLGHCCDPDSDPEHVATALQAAVENGDLLKHGSRYATTDPDSLRAVATHAVEAGDELDRDLLVKANRLLEGES